MKRVFLATIGTVAGLLALLSFKTHGQPLPNQAGALPSAGLPGTSAAPTPQPSGSPSTTAPPVSGRGTTASPRSATRPAAAVHSYLGAAIQTQYGVVQVKLTASGSKITNVSFQQLTAFDGRSQEINSQAAPILLQETLTAQSGHIDTVSGATYTSEGYLQSLQSALDQAGIK